MGIVAIGSTMGIVGIVGIAKTVSLVGIASVISLVKPSTPSASNLHVVYNRLR